MSAGVVSSVGGLDCSFTLLTGSTHNPFAGLERPTLEVPHAKLQRPPPGDRLERDNIEDLKVISARGPASRRIILAINRAASCSFKLSNIGTIYTQKHSRK